MAVSLQLGAHTSISGGLHNAIKRSQSFDGTALQIFSKNNNRWDGKELTDKMVEEWFQAVAESPIALDAIAIHDSYLINLCSPKPETFEKSYRAFLDEHQRAERLGIHLLNFHPGAALDRARDEAIEIIAEQVNLVHRETENFSTISVLEVTAGQGSTIGYQFEELQSIIELTEDQARIGVCIDTCHIFAAGYDISTEEGYYSTMEHFDNLIGLDKLLLFHLNDSKKECGSRVDRHEHLGKGEIGISPFKLIVNDKRLQSIPMVIETPKSDDLHEDVENLTLLRSLVEK